MFIINDSTNNDVLYPMIDGARMGRGYDQEQVPAFNNLRPLFGDSPDQLKVIPKQERIDRIKEMHATKSTLRHLREICGPNGGQMPTLDQNGQGFCWAYSTTRAVMYNRALMNLPYKRLSAHAVACMVKNFRDEGGWWGLSLDFIRSRGVPTTEAWPEKSMSRSNDNPATWENAAHNIITEGWYDLTKSPYDRNLTFDQMMTCLVLRIPVPADFNFWSHSVCLHTPVILDGEECPEGDNSWTDGWGEVGRFTLQGRRAIPDGAGAIYGTTAGPM